MKQLSILISVSISLFNCFFAQDNSDRELQVKIKQFGTRVENLKYTLDSWHVSPIDNKDTLSSRLHHLFLSDLDPYLLFLTEEKEKELMNFKYLLDEEITEGTFAFLDSCSSIAYDGMQNIQEKWIKSINSDFILSYKDSVLFTTDRYLRMADDEVGLENRVKKWITYRVLESTTNNFPNLNLSNQDSISIAIDYCINQVVNNLTCTFHAMGYPDKNLIKVNLQEVYLNDLAQAYDPHSNFFSTDKKNKLESMLSPSENSFGLYFYDEDNAIKIYSIHQHSDAWKSNLLNIGDIIKQAIDQNQKVLIDNCTSAYELEELLMSTEVNEVKLTVLKPNGKEIIVELVKEELVSEENNLVSYVLKGEKNIGYISLPSFYTSWEYGQVDGCANDVAKEIIKLREDNIEGLVLDLRNNGGGSVMEAIDLAGIFIDLGPIGIEKESKAKPKLMKDMNRGAAYSGPLVVLINGGSASASEIVAGALQYHNRALIIGGESYGKATGQIVLPTDSTKWYTSESGTQTTDFVKVTISNIYQPDLNSHQLTGIKPDIHLPSLWESYYSKESDEYYPLVPDEIIKKVYFTPSLSIPIDELKLKSDSRVAANETFQKIIEVNDSIALTKSNSFKQSMRLADIYTTNNTKTEKYDQIYSRTELENADFAFEVPSFYQAIFDMDKPFQKNAARLKDEMEKDPVLNETFLILIDYIKIN